MMFKEFPSNTKFRNVEVIASISVRLEVAFRHRAQQFAGHFLDYDNSGRRDLFDR
jgi:hypothetical protein